MAAVKARANGEGTVFQRKDGRWVGEIQVGWLPSGKPDRRMVYRKTQQEARKALAEIIRQKDKGSLVAKDKARETVAGFAEYWLETHQHAVRPGTHKRYCEMLRLHIVPELGKHRLTALTAADIKLLVVHLLAKPLPPGQRRSAGGATATLAPRTVRHIYVALHTVLEQAVSENYIDRNPCLHKYAPKVDKAVTYTPNKEEVRKLLDSASAAQDRFHTLWLTAALTGARLGELLALQWKHIDFDAGTVRIEQNLLQSTRNGIPQFGRPKSERSRRTITVPQPALVALRNHKQHQLEQRLAVGEGYADNELVFCTHIGTPFSHRNTMRAFKVALKRAGLPEVVRIHDLRHAAATLMLQAGVPLKVVADQLGHQDISTTGNIYTDKVASLQADAAARLASVLDL